MEIADYKLADLLGIAGATIGIIIAAAIFLQCLSTKYVAAFDRYRNLTGEYRANNAGEQRHDSLQNQIQSYRCQTRYLNIASLLVLIAVLSSVIAAFFYIRVIVLMYMQEPAEAVSAVDRAPLGRIAVGLPALATLLFGIFPGLLFGLLKTASVIRF